MSTFVEFVSYNAPGVEEDRLMDLRRDAILAVKEAHPALLDVPAIMRTGEESYVDVWIYESQESADAANAGAAEIAPFMAFMGVLTDIEFQVGTMADNAASPLQESSPGSLGPATGRSSVRGGMDVASRSAADR